MLNAAMLSVVILSVIMLSVAAPFSIVLKIKLRFYVLCHCKNSVPFVIFIRKPYTRFTYISGLSLYRQSL